MADYTFHALTEPPKNDSSIQIILDVDALAAPARAALAGYVASLALPTAETQHLTWENVGVACLIQTLSITYYLPSLGTQTPAPDTKRSSSLRQRVSELQSLANKFPKCQLLLFARTSAAAPWVWINTEVIQNYGNRVNTLKLVPYLNQSSAFIPGKTTQIGLQFIADAASNSTLPQVGDRVTVQGSVEMDVNPIGGDAKKNDTSTALDTRLAALETLLQPFGAATASAAGTTGLVAGAAVGESDYLLRGDRTWQNPAAFVRMVGQQLIEGLKTFAQALTSNSFVRSVGGGDLTTLSSQSQALIYSQHGGSFLALVSAAAPTNYKIAHIGLNAQGMIRVKRLNDTYNGDISTLMSFDLDNNLQLPNFTNFGGNVFTKNLIVRGTLPSTQGGTINIPLGISSAKVVGFFALVEFDADGKMESRTTTFAGYEYDAYLDADLVVFRLHPTNSAAIVGKACSCLVIYTN